MSIEDIEKHIEEKYKKREKKKQKKMKFSGKSAFDLREIIIKKSRKE